ncbi:hypothetical protein AWB78_04938 [Caballeronia calidae]|uniref:DUF2971 domain-containing protein n=2 Tax=Caballeronia calidae TaxID=1777139 RepID=A0A158DAS4_9BURK|nr:hypothetical protein AWB78_04938 [Caballeronia calidae]
MSALRAPLTVPGFESFLSQVGIADALPSPSSHRTVYRAYLRRMQASAPAALERDFIESLGVLCLTDKKDDVLMWAHYAGNHRGVCVGFDSGAEPFDTARKVSYSEQRVAISDDHRSDDEQLVQIALLTKSTHWKYEREWRAVKRPVSDDEKEYYRQLLAEDPQSADAIANVLASEGGPGQYEFESSAIRVVCLGAEMSMDRKNEVTTIVREMAPHVRIEQMELDKRYFSLNSSRVPRTMKFSANP